MKQLRIEQDNQDIKNKRIEEQMRESKNEVEGLQRDKKRLEETLSNLKTNKNVKEIELIQASQEIDRRRKELEAKQVAINQNADIQKLSQRLMINRQEMKDKLLTNIKKSNSVLDFLNKEAEPKPEMFVNQSMANFGWEDQKNYMLMNEKFRGLVELLKNKLENMQREKDKLEKKNTKYKSLNKELKEKLENTKNEGQIMETTNALKEDRILKLREEIRDLKSANKEMEMEFEDNVSRRPISARGKHYPEPNDGGRNNDMLTMNTRNNFHLRGDIEKNMIAQIGQLERELSVMKEMVEKRDFKIEQLKEIIKNNEIIFEKSMEDHGLIINQKMNDYQNLLERLKEVADASQSFHEMIREVSEENLELKEKIDNEIRKRKRIVRSHKTEVEELKVQITRMGEIFSQMDYIKSHLQIDEEELEELEDDEEEDEEEDDEPQTSKSKQFGRFRNESRFQEDEEEEDEEIEGEGEGEEYDDDDELDEEVFRQPSRNRNR